MTGPKDDLARIAGEHADCKPEFIDGLWLWSCDGGPVAQSDWDRGAHLAAVLAPLLDQARADGARQALVDAADGWPGINRTHMSVPTWLRRRAATYTTTKESR